MRTPRLGMREHGSDTIDAVHAMDTFAPCHAPSAASQVITGASESPVDGSGWRSANGENDVTTAQTSLPVSWVVARVTHAPLSKCPMVGAGDVYAKQIVAMSNCAVVASS